MECISQIDHAFDLARGRRRPQPTKAFRVRRDNRHRPAIQPGQPRHHTGAPLPPDLEPRPLVHHRFHDRPHRIEPARITRHRIDQPFLGTVRRIAVNGARRQFLHRGRQVRQEPARAGIGLRLARHPIIHRAIGGMDGRAAQFLLGAMFARSRHHRRAGDKHLGEAIHQQRIMRHHHPPGTQPGHRSQAQRDHRHLGKVGGHQLPTRDFGDVGVTCAFQRAHTAAPAGAFDHADQRQAIFAGQLLGRDQLAVQAGISRAAAHGEIIGGRHHRPAINRRVAKQEISRLKPGHLAGIVITGKASQLAHLVKAAGIDQRRQPFAHVQLALVALAREFLRPAHAMRGNTAATQLINL